MCVFIAELIRLDYLQFLNWIRPLLALIIWIMKSRVVNIELVMGVTTFNISIWCNAFNLKKKFFKSIFKWQCFGVMRREDWGRWFVDSVGDMGISLSRETLFLAIIITIIIIIIIYSLFSGEFLLARLNYNTTKNLLKLIVAGEWWAWEQVVGGMRWHDSIKQEIDC